MAFLGVHLSHDSGRLLRQLEVPGNKVNDNDYHITLADFGENVTISSISKILETSYNALSNVKPFIAEIKEVDCFPSNNYGVPIIAKVVSLELQKLEKKLKKAYKKNNITFSKVYKTFIPHITVSYGKDLIEKQEFDPLVISVQEIVLWSGAHGDDKLSVLFPLKAPECEVKICKMKKAAKIPTE